MKRRREDDENPDDPGRRKKGFLVKEDPYYNFRGKAPRIAAKHAMRGTIGPGSQLLVERQFMVYSQSQDLGEERDEQLLEFQENVRTKAVDEQVVLINYAMTNKGTLLGPPFTQNFREGSSLGILVSYIPSNDFSDENEVTISSRNPLKEFYIPLDTDEFFDRMVREKQQKRLSDVLAFLLRQFYDELVSDGQELFEPTIVAPVSKLQIQKLLVVLCSLPAFQRSDAPRPRGLLAQQQNQFQEFIFANTPAMAIILALVGLTNFHVFHLYRAAISGYMQQLIHNLRRESVSNFKDFFKQARLSRKMTSSVINLEGITSGSKVIPIDERVASAVLESVDFLSQTTLRIGKAERRVATKVTSRITFNLAVTGSTPNITKLPPPFSRVVKRGEEQVNEQFFPAFVSVNPPINGEDILQLTYINAETWRETFGAQMILRALDMYKNYIYEQDYIIINGRSGVLVRSQSNPFVYTMRGPVRRFHRVSLFYDKRRPQLHLSHPTLFFCTCEHFAEMALEHRRFANKLPNPETRPPDTSKKPRKKYSNPVCKHTYFVSFFASNLSKPGFEKALKAEMLRKQKKAEEKAKVKKK